MIFVPEEHFIIRNYNPSTYLLERVSDLVSFIFPEEITKEKVRGEHYNGKVPNIGTIMHKFSDEYKVVASSKVRIRCMDDILEHPVRYWTPVRPIDNT